MFLKFLLNQQVLLEFQPEIQASISMKEKTPYIPSMNFLQSFKNGIIAIY